MQAIYQNRNNAPKILYIQTVSKSTLYDLSDLQEMYQNKNFTPNIIYYQTVDKSTLYH